MKTKVAALLVAIMMTTTQCMAQRQITVEAQNNDISNNLDLKAVATAFGESKNLEDFERRINDYDSGISNLDLNNDGQVDYLRVIEKNENNVHVVVIQAVLDEDVYQNVASIVVDKNQYNDNTTVQVIGDPYIYGSNYIIEPAYIYTPSIFSFFWGADYYAWHSPYYWGYYPNYYHHQSPFELNIYLSNVYGQVDHDQRYYYSNRIRNENAVRLQQSISRSDYASRHPESNFSNRNENVRNKRDFEFNRNGEPTRSVYQNNSSGKTRETRTFDNSNNTRNSQQNNGMNQRNSNNNNGRENIHQTNPSRTNSNEPVNRPNRSGWIMNSERNPNANPASTNNRNSDGNNNGNRNNTYQPRQNTNTGNFNGAMNRNNGNTRTNQQVVAPRSNSNIQRNTNPPVSRPAVRSETKDNERR